MTKQTAMERRREELRKRQQQAIKEGESSAGKNILDLSDVSVKWFKPIIRTKTERKKNLIDIIPFIVTQDWYKDLLTMKGSKVGIGVGGTDYKLEIPVHRKCGPSNRTVICRRLAFGEKCFRCDQYFEELDKGKLKKDELAMLKWGWRDFFNVRDLNNDPNENMLWEISYYNFETYLLAESQISEDDFITYADLEFGKSIEFKAWQKTLGQSKFVDCDSFEFIDRDEPYDESVLEESVPLDKKLILLTEDEINKICIGVPEDIEEEGKEDKEEQIQKEKSEKEKCDDLDEIDDKKELRKIIREEDLGIKISRSDDISTIKNAIRKAREDKNTDDAPFDSDMSCEFGHKFGVDTDEFDDCAGDCPEEVWRKCLDAREKNEKNKG